MTLYKIICLVTLSAIGSISLSSGYGIKRYPSNRMLDFNWPEPDEHIKKFPHEKYCHYYYQRETEELFSVRKCPAGDMFDYHIHECREKHTAQCWSHHYGKHAVHDHIHSKWRKHFKCPFPNGNYPDIFDCEKFIVCLDGTPHHKHCAPNHQFDKNRRHCVYAAVCANSTDAALLTHMCPYSSGKFSHPEDCSHYYHCHKSEPTVKTCERYKLFDEEDRECKDKELVHCKGRPNPYSEVTAAEPIVKSVATDDFSPSFSLTSFDTNTDDTKTVELSKQPGETANFVSSMSSEIINKTPVTKVKAISKTTLQLGATGDLYSTISSASTDQKVDQSEIINNSHPSSNATESAAQSAASDINSQSSMSSTNIAKTTVKSETTDNSHSSKSSANIVHSTVTASTEHH